MASAPWLFGSLFLGGFECSTHLNSEGRRLDLVAATQHDTLAAEDYALCRAAGLCALREAVRWPIVDHGGTLSLDGVRRLAATARAAGVLLIWDLMHYGYPDDLDPFGPAFVARFAAYARAVATVIREESGAPAWYTPINEISYTAWSAGEVGYMAPFAHGRGGDYKRVLVRAAIAATDAIWAVDPQARILSVDPLVRQHAPDGRPDLQAQADHFNRYVVTEAFDLLAGRLEPALGGSRAHLGVVGLNYYAGNQWTIPTPEQPQRFLGTADAGWIAVSEILAELQARYGGPLVIAETGSSGEGRPAWLAHLTIEAGRARDLGVDLQGICLYPVITSPDWEDPSAFFDGGLFDVEPQPDGRLARVAAPAVAAALRAAQAALDPANLPHAPLPAPPAVPSPARAQVVRLLDLARFKVDNFSYQTLLVGESLQVELYGLEPGGVLPPHRHATTEHILTILAGAGTVRIGAEHLSLTQGDTVRVPAGLYHHLHNPGPARLVVQQVSAPKPWDARFAGSQPAEAVGEG